MSNDLTEEAGGWTEFQASNAPGTTLVLIRSLVSRIIELEDEVESLNRLMDQDRDAG